MTPEQKIKHIILAKIADWSETPIAEEVTADNIDDLYDECEDKWDAIYEVREGTFETKLPSPSSRHYESKSVAAKAPDGSYVGWTYWYGGGKHAEPEAIDWMNEAYDLTVTEEQKMVTVRTFAKA
ncbi:hypothetical protein CBA19CS22_37925 [Caballeronia novacaledonica]|uniref:Uncharacterized protein n=1 Tax=Caballeronia novacaledonica TaxID=1544861 RepID=A0ACB5R4W2_9BURK|nr:hypothetical protein CBA19CS22_37925 [Caballeronia novacaledonica]